MDKIIAQAVDKILVETQLRVLIRRFELKQAEFVAKKNQILFRAKIIAFFLFATWILFISALIKFLFF